MSDIPELLLTTKRELFAAMAMQGILSDIHGHDSYTPGAVASDAVRHADALIAALSAPPSEVAFSNTDTSGGR